MNWLTIGRLLGDKPPRLPRCCAVLTAALLIAFFAVAPIAYGQNQWAGVLAAAVAAGVCLLAGLLALSVTALLRGPNAAMYALLIGMFFRLGLPLLTGMLLARRGGDLAEAGVFGLIVVFYLVSLAVETPLSLKVLQAGPKVLGRSAVVSATGGSSSGGPSSNGFGPQGVA